MFVLMLVTVAADEDAQDTVEDGDEGASKGRWRATAPASRLRRGLLSMDLEARRDARKGEGVTAAVFTTTTDGRGGV